MWDELYQSYDSLEEYFEDHPEEEDGFYDDMAFLSEHEDIIEFPEDWNVSA